MVDENKQMLPNIQFNIEILCKLPSKIAKIMLKMTQKSTRILKFEGEDAQVDPT